VAREMRESAPAMASAKTGPAPWSMLQGQVVLVTGASSGIGRDFCLDLARVGCRIVAAARRTDRLRSLCEEINASESAEGPRAIAVELDVSTGGSALEAAVQTAWDAFGRVDALINNAGIRGTSLCSLQFKFLIGKSCARLGERATTLLSQFGLLGSRIGGGCGGLGWRQRRRASMAAEGPSSGAQRWSGWCEAALVRQRWWRRRHRWWRRCRWWWGHRRSHGRGWRGHGAREEEGGACGLEAEPEGRKKKWGTWRAAVPDWLHANPTLLSCLWSFFGHLMVNIQMRMCRRLIVRYLE
jgi:hypothetical protein